MKRPRRRLTLLIGLLLFWSAEAKAEFDWPALSHLPHHDIALGLSGGVTFGESGERSNIGASGALDLSYLHGLFGAHLSLGAYPERTGVRLQPLAEFTFWYVVLVGAGLSVSPLVGERPADVSETAVALHVFLGLPVPLWSAGEGAGAFWLVPFARPGLRVQERGEVEEHHTLGLMLKWTSFPF